MRNRGKSMKLLGAMKERGKTIATCLLVALVALLPYVTRAQIGVWEEQMEASIDRGGHGGKIQAEAFYEFATDGYQPTASREAFRGVASAGVDMLLALEGEARGSEGESPKADVLGELRNKNPFGEKELLAEVEEVRGATSQFGKLYFIKNDDVKHKFELKSCDPIGIDDGKHPLGERTGIYNFVHDVGHFLLMVLPGPKYIKLEHSNDGIFKIGQDSYEITCVSKDMRLLTKGSSLWSIAAGATIWIRPGAVPHKNTNDVYIYIRKVNSKKTIRIDQYVDGERIPASVNSGLTVRYDSVRDVQFKNGVALKAVPRNSQLRCIWERGGMTVDGVQAEPESIEINGVTVYRESGNVVSVVEKTWNVPNDGGEIHVVVHWRKMRKLTFSILQPHYGTMSVQDFAGDITNGGFFSKKVSSLKVTAKAKVRNRHKLVGLAVNGVFYLYDRESIENQPIDVPTEVDVDIQAVFNDTKGPRKNYRYGVLVSPDIQFGRVEVNPCFAEAGKAISVFVHPNEGYELTKLYYYKFDGSGVSGSRVDIKNLQISMPDYNIQVFAEFSKMKSDIRFSVKRGLSPVASAKVTLVDGEGQKYEGTTNANGEATVKDVPKNFQGNATVEAKLGGKDVKVE